MRCQMQAIDQIIRNGKRQYNLKISLDNLESQSQIAQQLKSSIRPCQQKSVSMQIKQNCSNVSVIHDINSFDFSPKYISRNNSMSDSDYNSQATYFRNQLQKLKDEFDQKLMIKDAEIQELKNQLDLKNQMVQQPDLVLEQLLSDDDFEVELQYLQTQKQIEFNIVDDDLYRYNQSVQLLQGKLGESISSIEEGVKQLFKVQQVEE